MADKKGQKNKTASVKASAAKVEEAQSEYEGMDIEMLREVIPMLRRQFEKTMFDRNYVQLERDAIQRYYDITKCEIEESDLIIAAKEREIESLRSNHEATLLTYKQKEKQLEYMQYVKMKEIEQDERNNPDRPLGISNTQQKETITDLKSQKAELDLQKQQIESIYANHIEAIKQQYANEISEFSQHFEAELSELKNRHESRSRSMDEDYDMRRRVDVHEIEEQRNSHINELMSNHKHAFNKLKDYYETISAKDKKLISVLQDDIKDTKLRLEEYRRTVTALKAEYTRLAGMSAREAAMASSLQYQATQRNRTDVSLKNARSREYDLQKKIARLRQAIMIMEQEYTGVQAEYTELTNAAEEILQKTRVQSSVLGDTLDIKIKSLESSLPVQNRMLLSLSSDLNLSKSRGFDSSLSDSRSSDSLSTEDRLSHGKSSDSESFSVKYPNKSATLSTIVEDMVPASNVLSQFTDSCESLFDTPPVPETLSFA